MKMLSSQHNLIFSWFSSGQLENNHTHIFPSSRPNLKKKKFTENSTKISRIQRRKDGKSTIRNWPKFPMGNEHNNSLTKLEQRKPLCVHSPSVSSLFLSLFTCCKRQYPLHGYTYTMWDKRVPIRNRAGTCSPSPSGVHEKAIVSYFHLIADHPFYLPTSPPPSFIPVGNK
jgi:hypothetical protein